MSRTRKSLLALTVALACLPLTSNKSAHANSGDGANYGLGDEFGVGFGLALFVPTNAVYSYFAIARLGSPPGSRSKAGAIVQCGVMTLETAIWTGTLIHGLDEDALTATSVGMATWSAALLINGVYGLLDKPSPTSVSLGPKTFLTPTLVTSSTNAAPGLGIVGRF